MIVQTGIYWDENEQQPIRFTLKEFSIILNQDKIKVDYDLEILNSTGVKILGKKKKSYPVVNIPEIKELDQEGNEVTIPANMEFDYWREFIGVNQTQEEIFTVGTLEKIIRVNGFEGVQPMTFEK